MKARFWYNTFEMLALIRGSQKKPKTSFLSKKLLKDIFVTICGFTQVLSSMVFWILVAGATPLVKAWLLYMEQLFREGQTFRLSIKRSYEILICNNIPCFASQQVHDIEMHSKAFLLN